MDEKIMSIEEIDTHLAKHGFTGKVEALKGKDLCGIFKTVRPILVFVKALLFFKPTWQAILQTLIDALDQTCPS